LPYKGSENKKLMAIMPSSSFFIFIVYFIILLTFNFS